MIVAVIFGPGLWVQRVMASFNRALPLLKKGEYLHEVHGRTHDACLRQRRCRLTFPGH